MAFEGLSDKLEAAFKKLRGKGKLTETDVRNAMREVRLALLEADVNYKVARDFTAKVTERAIGAQVMESLTPGQMVVKIVNEELTELMGGTRSRLASAPHPPTVVMMCGLQGVGKTTYCAKLGLMLKNQGNRPLLVACDIYRPAAIKQLQVVGEKAGVPVFEKGTADPVEIAREAIKLAKDQGYDYVLLDTAGRLHIDEELMDELKRVKAEIKPHEILLLIDAMTGQDAVNVATAFNEALGVDGLVLTKLDATLAAARRSLHARSPASRSSSSAQGKSLAILMRSIRIVWPPVFSAWGDVLSLIEKAETSLDEKKAMELEAKLRKNKFDLNDLLNQLREMKKMGNLKEMLAMLPGVGKQLNDVEIDERQFDRTQAIILSMTPAEREKPDLINPSRKRRIAAGCGMQVEDVNRLLKQYRDMQRMFKQFSGKGMRKKMRRMGQLPPGHGWRNVLKNRFQHVSPFAPNGR